MSLTKIAFGLGLVVLMLPTDQQSQAKLFSAAAGAVNHAVTFCERNPGTCLKGAQMWAEFKVKAEFGGRMAWTLVTEQMNRPSQPSVEPAAVALPSSVAEPAPLTTASMPQPKTRPEPVSRGTLNPRDTEPKWRGPTGRTGT
jgi:hypothetical protein